MMIDLVEVTPKKINYKKVIITIIILLVIVAALVFAFVNKEKLKLQKKADVEDKMIAKQISYIHKVEFVKPLVLPVSSVDKINSIYDSDEKRVFLTFDDGPSRTVTPLLLDYLKQENIKVTFFVLGSRVEWNPDLVKREYEEGHYIANHGYSHVYSKIYESTQSILDEYYSTEQCIKNAIENQDYNSYLFRFPGGLPGGKHYNIKLEAKDILEQNGVAHLDWNALTGDAEGKNTIEDLLDYGISTIGDKNSVVILMHDASDKILTYETLPRLVAYFRENGYSFKNIYDIM